MLKRLAPHPILSIILLLVWLGLVNKVTLGNVILGGFLGLVVPAMTAAYWPNRPTIKNPIVIAEYTLIVLWDIVVANVQVAMIVLFKPNAKLRSKWVTVPLDLTSPEAITVLAGTITLTPGTVTAALSADGGALLVHCLDAEDENAVRDEIKTRYEGRLMEIFQ